MFYLFKHCKISIRHRMRGTNKGSGRVPAEYLAEEQHAGLKSVERERGEQGVITNH
jgi:hypothetical protein